MTDISKVYWGMHIAPHHSFFYNKSSEIKHKKLTSNCINWLLMSKIAFKNLLIFFSWAIIVGAHRQGTYYMSKESWPINQ